MRKIDRRRFIGILSVLTLGLGGLISSGINISSRASFVEVETVSLQTSYNSQSNTDSGDDESSDEESDNNASGSEDSDSSNDNTDDSSSEDSEDSQITVEVLSEPSNSGNNFDSRKLDLNNINIVNSDRVGSTDEGYFKGLSLIGLNERSRSKIGHFNDKGIPNGDSALIITNLGDIENNTSGRTVVIDSNIYNSDGVLDSNELLFPYRVVNLDTGNVKSQGQNLFNDTVSIEHNEIIEICIIIDLISNNTSLDSLKSITSIQFESI